LSDPYNLRIYAAPLDRSLKGRQISSAAHRMLESLLLENYALKPSDYTFTYGDMGKPHLLTELPKPNVCFNLSHTAGMAVLAIGGVPVGVDVEHSQRIIPDAIRSRWLDSCPPEDALREWTMRESYGKLTGEGFNFALPKRPHVCRTWELNGFTITACVYDCDADSLPDNIELFVN